MIAPGGTPGATLSDTAPRHFTKKHMNLAELRDRQQYALLAPNSENTLDLLFVGRAGEIIDDFMAVGIILSLLNSDVELAIAVNEDDDTGFIEDMQSLASGTW